MASPIAPSPLGIGFPSSSSFHQPFNGYKRRGRALVMASAASSTTGRHDYLVLGVNPGASRQDLKKAYRRLALQFHPDVCKDDHCSVTFMRINKAYERLMDERPASQSYQREEEEDAGGFYTDCWDDWEEWMGWEGAGIRDYSHVNPCF